MRHDVVFTVYRLKQSLKARSPSATPTPTPTTVGSTFNYPAKSIQESKSLVSTSTAATTKDLTSSVPSSSNRQVKLLGMRSISVLSISSEKELHKVLKDP